MCGCEFHLCFFQLSLGSQRGDLGFDSLSFAGQLPQLALVILPVQFRGGAFAAFLRHAGCAGEYRTPPEGTRQHFGALLVGYYTGRELHFAGKVGTGFSANVLESLYKEMHALRQTSCPFANLPEKRQGRWMQNITPREMSRCSWVKPKLVCQIRFSEWTRDGKLRAPVYLGLREDKDAVDVVRERPKTDGA